MNGQPEMRLLTTFAAVARSGSMTAAAEQLGYVPSAVSQHIAALERSLGGIELFHRRPGRRISTTAAGRALIEAVDDLLGATAKFQDTTRRMSGGHGVDLRIGAYGTAISHRLPTVLESLTSALENSTIRILEIETADGLPLLERGDLDVLIAARYRADDPPWPSDRLTVHHLGHERLILVTSRSQPPDPVPSFDQCRTAYWVAGAPTDIDRKQLVQWSAHLGFVPDVRYESPDYHTAAELIATGTAVGLVPSSVLSAPHNVVRLAPVPLPQSIQPPTREVLAVTRSPYSLPAIDELLDGLRRVGL